jgi:UDP-glucose 4-epimerase
MANILITGGTGYIGSHTAVVLCGAGHSVHILDNFVNSQRSVLGAIEAITGKPVPFTEVDLLERANLERVFEREKFDAVLHFAGLKSVAESVENPLKYYNDNITITLNLLACMQKYGVDKLVFSSSATVYGTAQNMPLQEDFPLGETTNPYATSKFMQELILQDVAKKKALSVIALRYFNPIGAHNSGLLGENPKGVPNNLCPYITQVLAGKLEKLSVYGDDYETSDGTAIRDYIHIEDLADGHLSAVENLLNTPDNCSYNAINLGRGMGVSVLEMIAYFEKAAQKKVPYVVANRRRGDQMISYAATQKAKDVLGFTARRSIEQACLDSWRYQEQLEKMQAEIGRK